MTDVTVTFKPQTVERFRAALLEASNVFRKTAPEAIRWASVTFLVNARGKTKVGQKQREAIPHPMPSAVLWSMDVYSQRSAEPASVWIDGPQDKRRAIARRGNARNSWNGCFRALNKRPPMSSGYDGSRLGSTTTRFDSDVPEAVLANECSYLPTIHPTILDDALRGVAKRFEAVLTAQAKRALKQGVQKAITV